MQEQITINSKWNSINFTTFVVTKLEIINGEEWVYYQNKQTLQEYSCLSSAFRSKFWKNVNE